MTATSNRTGGKGQPIEGAKGEVAIAGGGRYGPAKQQEISKEDRQCRDTIKEGTCSVPTGSGGKEPVEQSGP